MGENKRRKQAGTHGPVEADVVELMNTVGRLLSEAFNPGPGPKEWGFVLLTARFGDIKDGRVNYLSNGNREDMITMMKELIARMEGRHPEKTQTGVSEMPQ